MAKVNDMLIYLRKRSNLTQAEVAKKIGISRSSLANYESGIRNPSLEIMEAIADFYNVNMDTIFGHTDQLIPAEKTSEFSVSMQRIIDAIGDMDEDQLDKLLKIIETAKGVL